MKAKKYAFSLSVVVLLTGCSDSKGAITPYERGTPIEQVDKDLNARSITPIKICDYYFYPYEESNIVIQKSNDRQTVLKSECIDKAEPTRAEFSLVQYGMSPFEVITLLGLPISFEFKYSEYSKDYSYNIVGLTFRSEKGEEREIPFLTHSDYLYCCCPGYPEVFLVDYTNPG